MSNPKNKQQNSASAHLQLFIADVQMLGDPIQLALSLNRVLSSATILQQKEGWLLDQQLTDYQNVSALIEVIAGLGVHGLQNFMFDAETLSYIPKHTQH